MHIIYGRYTTYFLSKINPHIRNANEAAVTNTNAIPVQFTSQISVTTELRCTVVNSSVVASFPAGVGDTFPDFPSSTPNSAGCLPILLGSSTRDVRGMIFELHSRFEAGQLKRKTKTC